MAKAESYHNSTPLDVWADGELSMAHAKYLTKRNHKPGD